MKKTFLLLFISLALQYSCTDSNVQTFNTIPKTLVEIVNERKLDKSKLIIAIDKSDYQLSVKYNTEVLITYPCVFGFDPVKDKRMEGDGRTPEGTFKIQSKYPHKSWTYFMWIDYPTKDSELKHKNAKKNGEIPSDATIGGEVGIHGVPKGADAAIYKKKNWTLGCISLKNEHITDLYKSISGKTTVVITK